MASANQTLGARGSEFEADGTERTATLLLPGGRVHNTGTRDAWINLEAATVVTSQPVGASGRYVPPGGGIDLPHDCHSFAFKAAAAPDNTYLLYERP